MQQLLAFTRTGNHTLHYPIQGSLILQSLIISLYPQIKKSYLLRREAIILLKKKGSTQEVQKVITEPNYYTLDYIARRIFSASNGMGTLIREIPRSGGKIELIIPNGLEIAMGWNLLTILGLDTSKQDQYWSAGKYIGTPAVYAPKYMILTCEQIDSKTTLNGKLTSGLMTVIPWGERDTTDHLKVSFKRPLEMPIRNNRTGYLEFKLIDQNGQEISTHSFHLELLNKP